MAPSDGKNAMPRQPTAQPFSRQEVTLRAFAALLVDADPLNDLMQNRNEVLGVIMRLNVNRVAEEVSRLKSLTKNELWNEFANVFSKVHAKLERLREQESSRELKSERNL